MPGCSVPGCTNNYGKAWREKREKGEKPKTISTFPAPTDPQMLRLWKAAIPRANWSPSFRVCEVHFDPKHIIRFKEIRLPDGETARLPCRVRLDSQAFPYNFPQLDDKFSKHKMKEQFEKNITKIHEKTVPCSKQKMKRKTVMIDEGPNCKKSKNFNEGSEERPRTKSPEKTAHRSPKKRSPTKRTHEGHTEDAPPTKKSATLLLSTPPPSKLIILPRQAPASPTKKKKSPKKDRNNLCNIPKCCKRTEHSPLPTSDIPNEILPQHVELPPQDYLSTLEIIKKAPALKMPNKRWNYHVIEEGGHQRIIFADIDYFKKQPTIPRSVVFTEDNKMLLFIRGELVEEMPMTLNLPQNTKDLEIIFKKVAAARTCRGMGINGPDGDCYSSFCELLPAQANKYGRCPPCQRLLRKIKMSDAMRRARLPNLKHKVLSSRKNLLAKTKRLTKKLETQKEELRQLQEKCAALEEGTVNDKIRDLPAMQQEIVMQCLKNAKCKGKKGRRYSLNWIYECLLMRIKSPALYEDIRNREILPLPCFGTLRKYLSKIRSGFGFQDVIFDMMTEKAKVMLAPEKRGVLLIDEIKLKKGAKFDKNTCVVNGFVNLGEHTPENQKNMMADHGLVFMFQPFRGKWVQAVACFTSAGAASGDILSKLIVECIFLLEQAGYQVDGVVTDGASWNRSMWTKYGVTEDSVSCPHPCNESDNDGRRMWFISDFCHLLKCARNAMLKNKELKTPLGKVQLKHWEILVEYDEKHRPKRCKKLTRLHVQGMKGFAKMRVRLAFQFFSNDVASAMELAKLDGMEGMADCNATVRLVKLMNAMSDVMNSNSPHAALRKGKHSEKVLLDFLSFLNYWDLSVSDKTKKFHGPTMHGFKISIKATLEILDFLTEKCGFTYLMTVRLNQDALRFFGMIRSAGGCNAHPQCVQFAQLFRLLCVYSLVKPPRGSNISSSEMLKSLIGDTPLNTALNSATKMKKEDLLRKIIEDGADLEPVKNMLNDHNYDDLQPDFYAVGYMSGYVAYKSETWREQHGPGQCPDCRASLYGSGDEDHNKLTKLRSKGWLKNSSTKLFDLVHQVECAIQCTQRSTDLHGHFLFEVLETIKNRGISLIGCPKHSEKLTMSIIDFYTVVRLFSICEDVTADQGVKSKQHTKLSRLY